MNDSETQRAILTAFQGDDRPSIQPVEVLVATGQVTLQGKLSAQEIAPNVFASTLVRNEFELIGCQFRVGINGAVAHPSGTVVTETKLRRAVDLIRKAWVDEFRQEAAVVD
jgi:hypothetical protein